MPQSEINDLQHGEHTRVKVDQQLGLDQPRDGPPSAAVSTQPTTSTAIASAAASSPPARLLGSPEQPHTVRHSAAGLGGASVRGQAGGARTDSGSQASRGRGRGGKGVKRTASRAAVGSKSKSTVVGPPTPVKTQQQHVTTFFKTTIKCMACKQPLTAQDHQGLDDEETSSAFCRACRLQPDNITAVYASTSAAVRQGEEKLTSAMSGCMACHSGHHLGPVVCENSECMVAYKRLGAAQQFKSMEDNLKRLSW